jgi:hypothetical protein
MAHGSGGYRKEPGSSSGEVYGMGNVRREEEIIGQRLYPDFCEL